MEHERKKVLVGMSGGIDSSAVCLMLLDEGYEVVGVTMRVWDLPRQFADTGQEYPDFIQDARALAARLGIAHYVADERTAFKDIVVRNFVDEYLAGRTPNPCVMCNPAFKFRVLAEWADKLGCDYIATGHYARIGQQDGRYFLRKGVDETKDQTYFLWTLTQENLARTIFPLGELTKPEVRQIALEKGYEKLSKKSESQEICFIQALSRIVAK